MIMREKKTQQFGPLPPQKKNNWKKTPPKETNNRRKSVSSGDLPSDENARLRSYSAENSLKSFSGEEVSSGDEWLDVP